MSSLFYYFLVHILFLSFPYNTGLFFFLKKYFINKSISLESLSLNESTCASISPPSSLLYRLTAAKIRKPRSQPMQLYMARYTNQKGQQRNLMCFIRAFIRMKQLAKCSTLPVLKKSNMRFIGAFPGEKAHYPYEAPSNPQKPSITRAGKMFRKCYKLVTKNFS